MHNVNMRAKILSDYYYLYIYLLSDYYLPLCMFTALVYIDVFKMAFFCL